MTKQVHSEESRTKCTYAGRLRTHTHKTLCSFAVDVHKLYISWIWLHQIRLHVCHAHAHILRYAVCHWQSGSQFWHIKYERFNDVVVCLLAAAYCSARAHTHNTTHNTRISGLVFHCWIWMVFHWPTDTELIQFWYRDRQFYYGSRMRTLLFVIVDAALPAATAVCAVCVLMGR